MIELLNMFMDLYPSIYIKTSLSQNIEIDISFYTPGKRSEYNRKFSKDLKLPL